MTRSSFRLMPLILVAAITLSACGQTRGMRMATGAAGGAVAGQAIAGEPVAGAIIGAGIGAVR
ncbi:MAG: hypothetical protein QM656_04770 [Paracoccaceae bacterium]